MAIDVHTHWMPESATTALRAGRTWHGWRLGETPDGREALISDAGVAPFSLSITDEPWSERIAKRRQDGIDVQALMLPTFLWSYHLPGPEAASFCRDVNEEVAALAADHPGSIVPMGVLPLQDREASETVLSHAVGLGIRTFSVGSHVEGRDFDDPSVSGILDALAESESSVMIHASYFDRAGEERMGRHDFGNSIGVPLESGLALMSVVYSGVLDRWPEFRVGACHGGGWAPYGIGRLWLRYTQGRDGGVLDHEPAWYLRRLFYDCLVHDDDSLDLLLRRVGWNQVMIGSDYPYKGDMPGGSVRWIESLQSLGTEERDAILEGNAVRFLGLES